MDNNVGAEVGQKMRSAIKAKLTELGCYVDDELPDYIMVMVANKRTKSQMNEDLQLFLTNKTSVFVDWLIIVLKKLKEITVTNPDVYKKVSKRKSSDSTKSDVKTKKEKKDKAKTNKKSKKKDVAKPIIPDIGEIKSLTDDLPVEASKLSEMRKIVIMQENQNNNSNVSNIEYVNEDSFDIPPLSEVAISNESELLEIEKKIKSVKSRLGLQVDSEDDDVDDDDDFINIKAEPDELFSSEKLRKKPPKKKTDETTSRKIKLIRSSISIEEPQEHADVSENAASIKAQDDDSDSRQKNEHPRIIFGTEQTGRKISVLDRLGKRSNDLGTDNSTGQKRNRISLTEVRREENEILGITKVDDSKNFDSRIEHAEKDKMEHRKIPKNKNSNSEAPRQSALKRLGVMSKVAVPQKVPIEPEEEIVVLKEVPSAVKVKPRVIPSSNNQANKNLLLKAVADAQRSIAQTPVVGSNVKPDALYTKRYREKIAKGRTTQHRKLSDREKNKIKSILVQKEKKDKRELEFSSDDDNLEYIPKPIKRNPKINEELEYIPSAKDQKFVELNENSDADVNNSPEENKGHTFIITLDGITRRQEQKKSQMQEQNETCKSKEPEKKRSSNEIKKRSSDACKKRRLPSPIVFNTATSPVITKGKEVPDKLPVVFPQPGIKTKEKCKYWPTCRQGEKCEFVHPSTPCKTFPQCKFGEKCLYIHPMCKFETSCTRKDCAYNHSSRSFSTSAASTLQTCKFFPNCSNSHCMFYHPRPCKYGKFCKNQSECNFAHSFPTKSNNFSWHSSLKL